MDQQLKHNRRAAQAPTVRRSQRTVNREGYLVVLEENPLESLQALGGVTGVVLRGKWFVTSTLRDLRNRDTRAFRSEEGTPK